MSQKQLSSEESRIQGELVNASVAHHAVFAAAIEVNQSNAQRWQRAASVASQLSQSLQSLHVLTDQLVVRGQEWRKDKVIASAAVAHHQKVSELLDAPQTLDVCLRNDMFHEALLILDYVRSLVAEERDGKRLALLSNLRQGMESTLRLDLETVVLPRLMQPLPLTSAVKLITFLRRLHTPENILCTLFLQSKASLVDQSLREAESLSHTPFSFLSKLLQVYKVQVTEVIHQFVACFPSSALHELGVWSHKQAVSCLHLFEAKLHLITNGAEIASLMDQAAACSVAAARVGMDLSALLGEPLCQRVRELFSAQLHGATSAFRAAVQSFSWKLPLTPTTSAPALASTSGPEPPPASLLSFLPLAYAMNGILSALNEIRKCATKSLSGVLCEELFLFLKMIATDVRRVQRSAPLMEAHEQQSFQLYRQVFIDDFVPHVLTCVSRVFPTSTAAIQGLRQALHVELVTICSADESNANSKIVDALTTEAVE